MVAAQNRDVACAVDDHIAVFQIGKITHLHLHTMRVVHTAVQQVLALADDFLAVHIHKNDFVRDALKRHRIGAVGTHMAHADYTDNPFFHNIGSFLQVECFLFRTHAPKLGNSTSV